MALVTQTKMTCPFPPRQRFNDDFPPIDLSLCRLLALDRPENTRPSFRILKIDHSFRAFKSVNFIGNEVDEE
jgi:hypothetical protein